MDTTAPITRHRVVGAVTAVASLLVAAAASFFVAFAVALCGLFGERCTAEEQGATFLFLALAALCFLATGPAAGAILRRWWAWLTPVWTALAVAVGWRTVAVFGG